MNTFGYKIESQKTESQMKNHIKHLARRGSAVAQW